MKRASEVPPVVLSSGVAAGHAADRLGERIADDAGRHQEGFAADRDVELVAPADIRVEPLGDPVL